MERNLKMFLYIFFWQLMMIVICFVLYNKEYVLRLSLIISIVFYFSFYIYFTPRQILSQYNSHFYTFHSRNITFNFTCNTLLYRFLKGSEIFTQLISFIVNMFENF